LQKNKKSIRKVLKADREHRLQVVPGIGLEGQHGFRLEDLLDGVHFLSDEAGQFLVGWNSDNRHQVIIAANRIDLGDAGDFPQLLRDRVDVCPFDTHEND
jgi:hypothetical protein